MAEKTLLNGRRAVALAMVLSGVLVFLSVPVLQSSTKVPLDSGVIESGRAGFADLIEQVRPAVVNISVEMDAVTRMPEGMEPRNLPPGMEEFFKRFFEQQSWTPSQNRGPGTEQRTGFGRRS